MPETLKERQEQFGPYYFGAGDVSAPGPSTPAGMANPGAPNIASNTPTTIGGFAAQAVGAKGLGGKAATAATNIGLNALLGLANIPTMALTGPTNALLGLSQIANRFGLQGSPNMGLALSLTPSQLGMMGFATPEALAIAAGSLGIDPDTFGSMNLSAPLGQPSLDPATLADAIAAAQEAANPSSGNSPSGNIGDVGGLGGGPGDAGGGSADFHRGGRVGRGAPKGPERRANLLEGEYVINPKAAKLRHTLLEAINKGASTTQLATILKAGR